MRIKAMLMRYRFLFRLIAMSGMVIGVAVLVSILLIVQRSQRELELSGREYRLGTARTFADYYNEQLMQMLSAAINTRHDAALNRQTVEKQVYNQIEAIEALSKRRTGSLIAAEMCVYYPGADYVITSLAKYNLDFFVGGYIAAGDEVVSAEARAFLTGEHLKRIEYYSTFGKLEDGTAKLIVSVQSGEGAVSNPSEARVFYILTGDSLSTSFVNSIGADDCGLAILDARGQVIAWSENMTGRVAAMGEDLKEKATSEYERGGVIYNAYLWRDDRNGLSFVTTLPREVATQRLIAYSRTMQLTIWVGAALLLMITAISVWVSYTPVRSVVSRLRSVSPSGQVSGELQSILDMIDRFDTRGEQVSTLMMERRMACMDQIMNNLLSGMPIRPELFAQIGADFSGRTLYAISAVGLSHLDNASREALLGQLRRPGGAELFMLDPPAQDHMVLVCGLKKGECVRPFVERAQLVFQQYAGAPVRLGVGNGVEELNDLHRSYMNSISALREGGSTTYYCDLVEHYSALEFYPSGDVLRYIRCVEAGQHAEAMLALDDIQRLIAQSIQSVIHERYICYNIVGTLLRLAERLEVPLPREDADRLMLFCGFEELRRPLNAATLYLCGRLRRRREEADERSRSRLVAYVDEHFGDANLSLVSMADVFGMSIYTLSRVFKEAAGMGFKEYVTGKRMIHAKELLSSDIEIREIAARVGGLSPEYFAKMFKGYYGVSPSEARREFGAVERAEGE